MLINLNVNLLQIADESDMEAMVDLILTPLLRVLPSEWYLSSWHSSAYTHARYRFEISVCPSVCPSVRLPACLSVCLSVSLCLSLRHCQCDGRTDWRYRCFLVEPFLSFIHYCVLLWKYGCFECRYDWGTLRHRRLQLPIARHQGNLLFERLRCRRNWQESYHSAMPCFEWCRH